MRSHMKRIIKEHITQSQNNEMTLNSYEAHGLCVRCCFSRDLWVESLPITYWQKRNFQIIQPLLSNIIIYLESYLCTLDQWKVQTIRFLPQFACSRHVFDLRQQPLSLYKIGACGRTLLLVLSGHIMSCPRCFISFRNMFDFLVGGAHRATFSQVITVFCPLLNGCSMFCFSGGVYNSL